MNIFAKKTIASLFDVPTEQVDMAFAVADKINDSNVDKTVILSICKKLEKKTPEEINAFFKFVDSNLS